MKHLASITLMVAAAGGGTKASDRPPRTAFPDRSPQTWAQSAPTIEAYGKLPLAFEVNRGQTDAGVKFLARGPGYTVFLTSTEAVLALQKPHLSSAVARPPAAAANAVASERAGVVRARLLGANPKPRVVGSEERAGRANYYIGKDPAAWRANIPTYARVHYRDVYPGVDLIYYGHQGQLEYDFVVAPRADPDGIGLGFDGADRVEIDAEGDLLVHVDGGQIRQRKPVVYQETRAGRTPIDGRYVLRGRRGVGFHVAAYDRSRPLVIDPVLVYSTLFGGSSGAQVSAIAADDAGHALVAGSTGSAEFPTANAAQPSLRGPWDAFVAKLTPGGTGLVYATYLGGTGGDAAGGIAVDADGNAYVAGWTSSLDLPTTPGALQADNAGGADAFVAVLAPSGVLAYGTYLGGRGSEWATGIGLDGTRQVYLTGGAYEGFPTTPGAAQPEYRGQADAFVARLDLAASRVVYATYLGGSDGDAAQAIAVGADGHVYVTGGTASIDFPTVNPIQATNPFPCSLVFVTKLAPDGSVVYSTTLGTGWDDGHGIAVDGGGNAYVTGKTRTEAWDGVGLYCGDYFGWDGAFVAKLDSAGSRLVYVTMFASWYNHATGRAIAVDPAGRAYVTGDTAGPNFPTTPDALQETSPNTSAQDAFLVRLTPAGSIDYGSYLGGTDHESGEVIALDGAGNVYLAGWTESVDYPLTPGAMQTDGREARTPFVMKFRPPPPGSDAEAPDTVIASAVDDDGAAVPDLGATMSTSIVISLAGTDNVAVAGFECRLYGAAFAACGSPVRYTGLVAGWHYFEARAVDAAGNKDASPAQHSWQVDDIPQTSITSMRDGDGNPVATGTFTASTTLSLSFTGSDQTGVAGFECRLDAAVFAPCTSPATYTGLGLGSHWFWVRAVDTFGNRDTSPAYDYANVDARPQTVIGTAMDGRGTFLTDGGASRSDMITFTFDGSDNGRVVGFECSLDGVAFAACTSATTYDGIAWGGHMFRVRAIDENGFRDDSPAAFMWKRAFTWKRP